MSDDYVEHRQTTLNCCSVETLWCRVTNDDDVGVTTQQEQQGCWAIMVGCYELDEASQERIGHLDLYAATAVASEDDGRLQWKLVGEAHPVLSSSNAKDRDKLSPGILDGKWLGQRLSNKKQSLTTLLNDNDDPISDDHSFYYYYATAHANGDIQIRSVALLSPPQEEQAPTWNVTLVGKATTSNDDDGLDLGLCLALAWDDGPNKPSSSEDQKLDTRIISSYSKGRVQIHTVKEKSEGDGDLELTLTHSWDAHKMFHSPAEVWCAAFSSNVACTGGDEGTFKIWNVSEAEDSPPPPLNVFKTFDAGVTVLSPHPTRSHFIAVGSYDETIALFDLTNSDKAKLVSRSDSLGGGIWRIKWHPIDENRLLIGAMHGGCRVVTIVGGELDSSARADGKDMPPRFVVDQEFTKHESMAYGAGWLVQLQTNQRNGPVDAAVSCSFYDRAMYLWGTSSHTGER